MTLLGPSTSSGRGTAGPPTLSIVGNSGRAFAVSTDARRALRSFGATRATLLATRGHRNFFRIESPADGACYGSGDVENPQVFGIIGCETDPPFPSAGRPLLDLSLVDIELGSSDVRAVRLEGVAADGVARVGVLEPTGRVAATTAVDGNVYKFDRVPKEPLAGIAAFDRAGRLVYRFSWVGAP